MAALETAKKKVLIVDDDAKELLLISRTLEGMGLDVLQADNGQDALAMIRQVLVDLIILDQMMPKMDGIKACALIKSDKRYRNIPVIIFTASAEESVKKIAQQVGADAFCNKPLSVPTFTQKVRELLKI
jgi:CheY-like chemotaxis protein